MLVQFFLVTKASNHEYIFILMLVVYLLALVGLVVVLNCHY